MAGIKPNSLLITVSAYPAVLIYGSQASAGAALKSGGMSRALAGAVGNTSVAVVAMPPANNDMHPTRDTTVVIFL